MEYLGNLQTDLVKSEQETISQKIEDFISEQQIKLVDNNLVDVNVDDTLQSSNVNFTTFFKDRLSSDTSQKFISIYDTFDTQSSIIQTNLYQYHLKGQSNIKPYHIPDLTWPTKDHPFLTNRIRELVQILWSIVVSRSIQVKFRLVKTSVAVIKDPTDDNSKAVLQLKCIANVSQALAFWDSLETDLQNWLNKLNNTQRDTFLTKISLRIYWH